MVEKINYRQGDVILEAFDRNIVGKKVSHLVLAEGEKTGHKHQIVEGIAELYDRNGTLYLKVLSDKAILAHEEHDRIEVPQGNWAIKIQREYDSRQRQRSISD